MFGGPVRKPRPAKIGKTGGLPDLFKLYIIAFIFVRGMILYRCGGSLAKRLCRLLHAFLHLAKALLHLPCGAVNGDNKVKHQLVSQVEEEGIEKKP